SARPHGHAEPPEVRAPRSGKRSRPSPSRPRRPSRTAFADSSHTHMFSFRPRPNAPHLHFEHALHTVVDSWSTLCCTPNNSSALEPGEDRPGDLAVRKPGDPSTGSGRPRPRGAASLTGDPPVHSTLARNRPV